MRQRREKEHLGRAYEHIPRDTAGDPVFLILPEGVRATYDRWMSSCKAGWLETGDPSAISAAHTMTMLHRQVPPVWLDEAVYSLANARRTKVHAKRAREAMIRRIRYEAVRDAHASGLTWENAYERAAEVLADSPAAAEPDRMRRASQDVKQDLKTGRGGRYFTPHQQKRKALNAGTTPTKAKRKTK